MIIPINVDVPMQRYPIANWVLIAVTMVISIYALTATDMNEPWMYIGPGEYFSAPALIGNLFIHLDILHLIGNMLFLFVFGNAINAKLGHLQFLACYLLIGITEGLIWAMIGPGPAAGASGAIMGLTGMFIVLYPRNEVTIFYWFYAASDTFEVSAYIVIATYFGFDLWGLTKGADAGVAFLAHIAGSLAGFAIASGLVLTGLITSDEGEQNLYEALGKR